MGSNGHFPRGLQEEFFWVSVSSAPPESRSVHSLVVKHKLKELCWHSPLNPGLPQFTQVPSAVVRKPLCLPWVPGLPSTRVVSCYLPMWNPTRLTHPCGSYTCGLADLWPLYISILWHHCSVRRVCTTAGKYPPPGWGRTSLSSTVISRCHGNTVDPRSVQWLEGVKRPGCRYVRISHLGWEGSSVIWEGTVCMAFKMS